MASCGSHGPNPDDGHLRGKTAGFIRTTVVGGLLFLLPLVVLIIVFDKVASVLRPFVDPIAALLPFESLIGLKVPVVLNAILMIAICFDAGLIARAHIAQSFVQTIEVKLLNKRSLAIIYLKTSARKSLSRTIKLRTKWFLFNWMMPGNLAFESRI